MIILNEKWFALSLVQQMVNIGNEVKRALKFDSNPDRKSMFLDKAIQYTRLTMEDYRGEHWLSCTEEQIRGYYNAYQYLLSSARKQE